MRVFRSSYRNRQGKSVPTSKWYVEFRDHHDTVRRVPAFTSKSASTQFGINIDRLVGYHKATGGGVDPSLESWLAGLPRTVAEKLVSIGLVPRERAAQATPLADHVADYRASLAAKGGTAKHVRLVTGRLQKVLKGGRFTFWSDITASAVQRYLAGLQEGDKPLSNQTVNYYLAATKAFCNWMVKDRRATASPVGHLASLNTNVDRRHDRRALSAEEIRVLLSHVESAPIQSDVSGPDRAMLYRVALETGLRAGELRSLRVRSFDLHSDPPTVTVEASYSKHRREDVLPIRRELANYLGGHFSGRGPDASAFDMPSESQVARMIRADLASARAAWLQQATNETDQRCRSESDFLQYRDASGKVADFHALRHTFISNLVAGGVHPKTAQALARHSTITLTMDRYAHLDRSADSKALEALPRFEESVETPTSNGRAAQDDSASCLAQCEQSDATTCDDVIPDDEEQREASGPVNGVSEWARRDSNPHSPCGEADFESAASANSATPARTWMVGGTALIRQRKDGRPAGRPSSSSSVRGRESGQLSSPAACA